MVIRMLIGRDQPVVVAVVRLDERIRGQSVGMTIGQELFVGCENLRLVFQQVDELER